MNKTVEAFPMLDYRTKSSLLETEATYSHHALPALRLVRSSRIARRVAVALLCFLVISVLGMLFAPWQQSVAGSGDVIAYAPEERQQVIEAPIKGRVVRWGDGIQENAFVEKGQTILEIQDLDASLLDRLKQQEEAIQRQLTAAKEQLSALRRQKETSNSILPVYQSQIQSYQTVKQMTLAAAGEYISMAGQKILAERQNLESAQASLVQLEADYNRQKNLFQEGLASQAKFQAAEQKYLKAKADVKKAEAYVKSTENELGAKKNERSAKEREIQTKIESSTAALKKAEGDVAKAESDIAKSQSEIGKTEKELLDLQSKLARQKMQIVTAPRSGYILSLQANEGQMIKEGDSLCLLVPESADRAVQIWVDGNDVPLIEPGRHVRLQFEGWPAVQFAGWPSVAVGTFGGEVISVDSVDNGKGQFRVLVQAEKTGEGWPDDRYLRQGVRANAWVMLNEVTIGYELWRKLNGFPPVSAMESPKKEKSSKVPKSLKK